MQESTEEETKASLDEQVRWSTTPAARSWLCASEEAVALGGSWAPGEAYDGSDVDLGIHYRSEKPPPITDLRLLAQDLDDRHPPSSVTEFGEWGPWINGGGGLT